MQQLVGKKLREVYREMTAAEDVETTIEDGIQYMLGHLAHDYPEHFPMLEGMTQMQKDNTEAQQALIRELKHKAIESMIDDLIERGK